MCVSVASLVQKKKRQDEEGGPVSNEQFPVHILAALQIWNLIDCYDVGHPEVLSRDC
jgi:hypothetical protein